MYRPTHLLILPAAALAISCPAQLTIDNTQSANALVQNVLLGGGVTVSNITFNGMSGAAVYPQLAAFNSAGANVGIPSGVMLSTGDVQVAYGPNNNSGAGTPVFPSATDPDLASVANVPINDAAVLEFDFVPSGSQISFNFVFASEEYLEFVDQFNDAFGFFLSGPGISGPYTNGAANIALIPGTSTPVSINTLNNFDYPAYYVDNGDGFTAPFNGSAAYVQFDGLTVSIAASATVQCGQTYHIKLAVGDAVDDAVDSGVFLQANAFSSPQMVVNTTPDLNLPCSGTVDLSILNVNGGIAPYAYEWSFNGNVISTNQTITVPQGGQGTYTATVTDGCGAMVQEQVIVGAPVSPAMTLVVTPDLNLPCGGTVDLEVISLTGGTAPFTYEWTYNGNVISNGTAITVANNAPGTYTMTVDDGCGGTTQQSVVVGPAVTPPMTLTLTPNVALNCQGTADLSVLNVLGGTAPFTYEWTLNGNVVGNGTTINVTAAQPGTYTITVLDNCGGSESGTIVVSVPPPPALVLTTTPDLELPCQGSVDLSVLTVNNGIAPYTYVWTLNGNNAGNTQTITVAAGSPGSYQVTVQDACGGTGSATIQVSPPNMPTLTVVADDVEIACLGGQVQLVASATGGDGQYNYVWTDGNGTDVGNSAITTVIGAGDATYTVTVNDNCGQQTTTQMYVNAPDPLTLDLPNSMAVCEGGSVVVTAEGQGGGSDYTYLWQPSGEVTATVSVSPIADTVLSVTVTDACGASVDGQVLVYIEIPVVTIHVTEQGGDAFEFNAQCIPGAVSYAWTFSSGGADLGAQVQNTFADGDQFWATVLATTPAGCTDVDSVFLTPGAHLYFPNAFTPDGDGINDLFGPVGYALKTVEFSVFDRWGAEVFTATTPEQLWDGRFRNGQPVPTGVYVYKFRASGERMAKHEGIGSVTVLGQETVQN
ncbi:MAG: choice-of-anchor L domain-containing protein [Flavobacteriales bacterium]|nr:choice-of-anchor L domain-containing protein [Flavobacteriales bacterium]